ncbi:ABC transporter substrate-binding protein [Propionicimonas paludicola]|nr:ABC transporter substrate-binding protein [Propionicimonas paludicola]
MLTLSACTTQPAPPPKPAASSTSATPSPTPEVDYLKVATVDPITSLDPAFVTGPTGATVIGSVYQRLMTVLPTTGELKPDAADCLFTSKVVYECTLTEGLKFHNGDVLDSSDVKFSIQRALRIGAPGTSASLLSALRRIDTPDPRTVRFTLEWPDNQFGYALASAAASIVDEAYYDPDLELAPGTLPNGSGPYQVTAIGENDLTFARYLEYLGARGGLFPNLKLIVLPDSAAAEAAIADASVDVVWRGLDPAAQQRLDLEISASPDHATAKGFTRLPLNGWRTNRLVWSSTSKLRKNDALRAAIATVLQADRTADSIVPVGVPDHVAAFAVGGRAKPPKLKKGRLKLTLAYSSAAPGNGDAARLIRDRIEQLDGVTVRLVTAGEADLTLTDQPAWVNNAMGWLQAYLDHPLPASAAKLTDASRRARSTTGAARTAALAELQQQAATDNTVVPISQSDGIMFIGKGVKTFGETFGSDQALGLWGLLRG